MSEQHHGSVDLTGTAIREVTPQSVALTGDVRMTGEGNEPQPAPDAQESPA